MQINTRSTLKKYWREVTQQRWLVLLLAICVIAGSTSSVIVPLYFRKFFNVLTSAPREHITAALLAVLGQIAFWELVRWGFWRAANFISIPFQSRAIAELANQCFSYLHKHSFGFFNSNFVGSLVKRVNYFTRAFETTADRVTWNILPLAVELSVVLTVLFITNLALGLFVLAWIILFLFVNFLFASYKIKFDLERSAAETKATGLLADTITNHSNVKLFGGYARETERFRDAQDKVKRLRHFTWNLDNLFQAIQGILVVGLELGSFYIGIRLFVAGRFSVGDFVLLQTYVIVIFEKIWDFGKMVRFLYTDLADAEEMTRILDAPHEINDLPQAPALKVIKGEVEWRAVDFYYHATRRIFSGLNFIVRPQEKVALVGPSGAGKSTIVKLLTRLHDVTAGHIFIDGQAIDRVTQESLWSAIGVVPQEPILFHRSLLENIRYGRPETTDEEVVAAARFAHCDEFIREFPDQYQTFVGERGVKLSGGERQRVAIARAILRDAPILLLDEATSSLDSESERLIQDALATLMKNKTVLVIAHRLSTIMKMDRIIVIDRGRIVEEGTHAVLLDKPGGLYHELWKLQAGGFLSERPAATPAEALLDEPPEPNAVDS